MKTFEQDYGYVDGNGGIEPYDTVEVSVPSDAGPKS